jgi:hypothetical protein
MDETLAWEKLRERHRSRAAEESLDATSDEQVEAPPEAEEVEEPSEPRAPADD